MEVLYVLIAIAVVIIIVAILRLNRQGDALEPLRERFQTKTVFPGGLLITSTSHPHNPPALNIAVTPDALHLIHDITGVQLGEIPVNSVTEIAFLDEDASGDTSGYLPSKDKHYIRLKWADVHGPLTSIFEFTDETDAQVMYAAVREAAGMPAG
jgi:hypothetical protein